MRICVVYVHIEFCGGASKMKLIIGYQNYLNNSWFLKRQSPGLSY